MERTGSYFFRRVLHVREGIRESRLPRARARGHQVLERPGDLPKVGRAAQGRRAVHVLRRPADRERQAAHRPHRDARVQGRDPALSDDEGQKRLAQGRLGHARPAGRARGRKAIGARRQGADRGLRHRAVHQGVQAVRLEVQGRVGKDVRARRLLAGHGKSLHHLRGQLHRVRLVEPEADRRQGPSLQGPQGRALLPALRNRALVARGFAGLQIGAGQVRVRALPRQGPREHLALRVDDDALDASFERRAVREPRRRVRRVRFRRQDDHHGQGADRVRARRGRRVRNRPDDARARARRHRVRAAVRLPAPARRQERVARRRGRLRHDDRRHRHRPPGAGVR